MIGQWVILASDNECDGVGGVRSLADSQALRNNFSTFYFSSFITALIGTEQ